MDKVKNYIESARALREKYEELKTGKITQRHLMEEKYKPILEPLETIKQKIDTPSKEKSTSVNTYIPQLSPKPSSRPDTKFGLYKNSSGDYYVGNMKLEIKEDNFHFENGMYFRGTPGLWELLTLETPSQYNNEDLSNYEKIVLATHTYKQNNNPRSTSVKSSVGYKYNSVIRPILIKYKLLKTAASTPLFSEDDNSVASTPNKTGEGLSKILTNAPVEYVYWNNLDELLDRVYVLWGEVKAGNKSPILINEIVNILQEIREL